MHVEVRQAENLHEIELLTLIVALRLAELRDAGLFADLIDLGRDEQLVAELRSARDAAEARVVVGVARPRVDELAAVLDERPEHARERRLALRRDLRTTLLEPEPDDRAASRRCSGYGRCGIACANALNGDAAAPSAAAAAEAAARKLAG